MLPSPNLAGEGLAVIIGLMLSMLVAADGPVPVVPPPVITPIRPAPPAPPAPPNSASPNGVKNLVSLFSTDDYPVEAMRSGEEGTAQVRLTITTDGRVSQCEVMSSSGSQVLDRATCDILQRRARFKPALDNQGRPTIDYFTQKVRWELPARPFQDQFARAAFALDPASTGPACTFEEQVNVDVNCDFLESVRVEILATTDLPQTGVLVVEIGQRVGKGEALLKAGVAPGTQRLELMALTFTVGADGRVSGCGAAFPGLEAAPGVNAADLLSRCDEARRWRYEPLADNGGKGVPRYLTTYRFSYLRD